MTGARLTAPRRRAAGLLVVLLSALTVPVVPAAAAPRPVVTNRGRLAGDTTIQWRGVAGIRLDTRPGGRLSEKDITLELRGGTYADVHLVPMPQPIGCIEDDRVPYCFTGAIRHFRRLAAFEPDQRPGHRNHYLLWDPPELFTPRVDLYLFTDGVATLRIRGTGYSGVTSYVAAGRVRGQLLPLPAGCALPAGCGSGAVVGGGRSFRAGAHAFAMVLFYDVQPDGTLNQPRAGRPCLYPNEFDRTASPRAEDHPFGCDPIDEGSPEYAISGYTFGTHVSVGGTVSYLERDVSGPRYAGFFAGTAPQPSERGGWVVWFDYGIR